MCLSTVVECWLITVLKLSLYFYLNHFEHFLFLRNQNTSPICISGRIGPFATTTKKVWILTPPITEKYIIFITKKQQKYIFIVQSMYIVSLPLVSVYEGNKKSVSIFDSGQLYHYHYHYINHVNDDSVKACTDPQLDVVSHSQC